jgi:hypothetical protein
MDAYQLKRALRKRNERLGRKRDENIQTFSQDSLGTFDVSDLWKIAPKAKRIPIKSISKNLSNSCWGDNHPSLRELIKLQRGKHWDIAMQSDLRYAIILTPEGFVADGNHRLVKAVALGKKTIMARRFESIKQMEPALIKR